MPRKQRKSSQHRKHSLTFTDSPVHIQHHALTPVLGAQHPQTAKSVPVEELNSSWVSPQFVGRPTDSPRRRRRNKSGLRSKSLSTTAANKDDHLSHTTSSRSKFKPLNFFGEQTTLSSVIEDIDITVDTDTNTDIDKENDISTSESYAGSDLDLSKGRLKRKVRSRTAKGGNSRKESVTDCKDGINNKSLRDKNRLSEINEETGEGLSGENYDDENDQNCDNDSSRFTRLRRHDGRHTTSPVKCLFGKRSKLKRCQLTDSDLSLSQDTGSEYKEESILEPERSRKLRFLDVTRTPERSTRAGSVLAADTPEAEYGVGLRKRQMKNIQRRDVMCSS